MTPSRMHRHRFPAQNARRCATLLAVVSVLLCACGGAPAPAGRDASNVQEKPSLLRRLLPVETVPVAVPQLSPAPLPILPPMPQPILQADDVATARRDAARALAKGRLYQGERDAIPLYQALLDLDPDDARARAGLQRAGRRLLDAGTALLAKGSDDDAALANLRGMVAAVRRIAPDAARVQAFSAAVALREQAQAWSLAGEQALRDGDAGDGHATGAAFAFRQALLAQPESRRAHQGLADTEAALILRGEEAARAADFTAARQWLAKARAARGDTATMQAAEAALESIRDATITRLRDKALGLLQQPGTGLKPARALLTEMRRIADKGDPRIGLLGWRIDLAEHYGVFGPGQVFTDALADASRGPQMVVVPHGRFDMGADADEPGAAEAERPRHEVRFERGFAMSVTEVTVAQFRRYVAAAQARPRATRRGFSTVYDLRGGNFVRRSGVDWRSGYDGRAAGPDDPVLHVSVRDAEAYADWLSAQTGHHYRLPSEAEYEYALRAGGTGRYPWGQGGIPPRAYGNLAGGNDVAPNGRHWSNAFVGYGDGWWGPAPVGSFTANAWGLSDMGGNVSEWVADCWHASYRRAPADGQAWFNPGCRARVVRGGAWSSAPQQARSAWRMSQEGDMTSGRVGFRLVRGL